MVLLSVKGGTRGSIPTNTFDSISSRAVSLSELRSRLSKVTQSIQQNMVFHHCYKVAVRKLHRFKQDSGIRMQCPSSFDIATFQHWTLHYTSAQRSSAAVLDTKKEIKCLKTSPQQVNGLNYRGSVDPKSDPLLLDYLIKCFSSSKNVF